MRTRIGKSLAWGLCGLVLAGGVAGCEPQRRLKVVTHPPGTLRVPYEAASVQTSCLVASVAMAANYLLDKPVYSEKSIRAVLRQEKLDEMIVGDVKTYLDREGLYLVTLSGRLDGKPPLGLKFWVLKRGYPVICIINRYGDDPRTNHAVVVIGFSQSAGDSKADIVYYLDPSTPEPLQSVRGEEFEQTWAKSNWAMLIVVAPPEEAEQSSSGAVE